MRTPITPRPEFGKPETGLVRHWFRTDAQMRRNYMDPKERERARERISERRRQMKQARSEAEAFKNRVRHKHVLCRNCHIGLSDVGAFTGKPVEGSRESEERDAACCICLAPIHVGTDWPNAEKGPHHKAIWRCRVLHPDPVEDESDLAV